MEGDKYMKVVYKYFPEDIQTRYKLQEKVTASEHIYIKIKKGIYRLKQAAVLAYNNLKQNMAQYSYKPTVGTVGM